MDNMILTVKQEIVRVCPYYLPCGTCDKTGLECKVGIIVNIKQTEG